ncbi:MAG: hypothetical protein KDD34_09705, partial [Bdellovibrionales bacterium]|nr:hypothetical protein [Bdellovibrionales bacterium]
AEYSLYRTPGVLKAEGNQFTAYGETWSHQILFEWNMASLMDRASLFYLLMDGKKQESYIDTTKASRIGFQMGWNILASSSLSLRYENILSGGVPDQSGHTLTVFGNITF